MRHKQRLEAGIAVERRGSKIGGQQVNNLKIQNHASLLYDFCMQKLFDFVVQPGEWLSYLVGRALRRRFRSQSSRFRSKSSRFKAQRSKLRAQSSKLRAQSRRFRDNSFRFRAKSSRLRSKSSRLGLRAASLELRAVERQEEQVHRGLRIIGL